MTENDSPRLPELVHAVKCLHPSGRHPAIEPFRRRQGPCMSLRQPDARSRAPAARQDAVAPAAHQDQAAPRRLWSLAVFGIALVAMLILYRQLWADPFHRTLGSAHHTNDPMQTMWNLKWVPWQLMHGHNPLRTTAIYYPHGVSLSWNTCTPTLGIVAAPLTLTLGSVFAYAVLMTLGPALAALTGFWWLHRHTRRAPAAAVGGLLIGFSPYLSGHLMGHLNLIFVPLIPIMLMLLEDLLWRRPRPARRTAGYLGLVTAAQAGISEELILIIAIAVLLAAAGYLLADRAAVGPALRSSWRALLLAIGVFLLAASPLLIDQLLLATPVSLHAARWRATIGDYFLPLHRQLLDFAGPHHSYLGAAEDGVYLGFGLFAVLVIGIAVTARRDRAVRVAAVTLAVLILFTFGTSRPLGFPLPWAPLSHLPVLTSILPARFSFASFFVIAWLLARWIDTLLGAPDRANRRLRPASTAGLAALAAALLMIVPRPFRAISTPPAATFFTSSQLRTLLAPGAPVLLLPSPTFADASGMYYQQHADFRFSQPGGYALRRVRGGASYGPAPSPLVTLAAAAGSAHPPHYPRARVDAARRQLSVERFKAVFVVRSAPHAGALTRLAELLTGHPADRVTGGVSIWLLAAGH